ncbi:MAG: nuclease SbcCD subunit C, partial [Armatimonadetes bacterium]|nr:nuclease SbcCD subunit C [Armatimonadota bacterium]
AADETFAESAAALARETRSLEAALGPLDVAALRALLAHGDDWLHARRRTLARLAEEVRRSATVLEERRRQREAHENGEAPRLPADEATARLGQAREALQAAEKALIERRRDLAVDDDRLRHARALQESLSERRARAAVWQNLNELIGSADGKKFQVFAQSLTLDALLAYANEHLRDLAPRYRLMRVPGHDLDLQVVDRDMGDEARTINGLSGGETFLVSLSLALGLSSLSAERIQVESLFVDEGFGTLDPDTLEGALATLDALQASGRQVGLISHVPGLAERIGARIEVVPQGAGRSVVRC